MAAITMDFKEERTSKSPLLKWVLLLILPIILLAALPKSPIPKPEDVVVTEVSHATKHGADALSVRQCLKDRGARQTWRMDNRVYFVCHLPDGRWGLQIAAYIDGKLQEITSYIRENTSTIEQISNYLKGHAKCLKGCLP